MMQYIGDLVYLFNIYVNVSHLFAACFWFFFFFWGGRQMSPPRVTGPVMEVYSHVVWLGSLSWVWGHVVGSDKILTGLCCSDPNGVVVRAVKLWLKNLHEGVSMAPLLFQLKCWFLSGWVPLWQGSCRIFHKLVPPTFFT